MRKTGFKRERERKMKREISNGNETKKRKENPDQLGENIMLVKKFASSLLLFDIDNASLMNVLINKTYVRGTIFKNEDR